MEESEPSPADVLLRELQRRAAAREASSEGGHLPPANADDVAPGAVASPEHPSDCSESAGHPRSHSWQAMLGERAPLHRPTGSLDHLPLPDHLHPQQLNHLRFAPRAPRASPDAFGSSRRRADASDVARGVAARLRRSHTVPISSLDAVSERTLGDAQAVAAAAAAAAALANAPTPPPPASLVDRLRASVAVPDGSRDDEDDAAATEMAQMAGRARRAGVSTAAVRRSTSSPAPLPGSGSANAAFDARVPVPALGGHPLAAAYPRSQAAHPRGGFEVTFGASEAATAAAARAAAEHAARPRPFGYLGVTRPAWTTRWEAHLSDEASGERVFLGNFDAKESAARAHDAAKIKLYGPPPACGELNFDADEYLGALAEMRECTFEEFVKGLVRHSYGGERQHSRYRGVHAGADGRWEARLAEPEERRK